MHPDARAAACDRTRPKWRTRRVAAAGGRRTGEGASGVARGADNGGEDPVLRGGRHREEAVVAAEPQYRRLVRDRLDVSQVVTDEDHSDALLAELLDEVEDVAGL